MEEIDPEAEFLAELNAIANTALEAAQREDIDAVVTELKGMSDAITERLAEIEADADAQAGQTEEPE